VCSLNHQLFHGSIASATPECTSLESLQSICSCEKMGCYSCSNVVAGAALSNDALRLSPCSCSICVIQDQFVSLAALGFLVARRPWWCQACAVDGEPSCCERFSSVER
jgi:hypothetical protein